MLPIACAHTSVKYRLSRCQRNAYKGSPGAFRVADPKINAYAIIPENCCFNWKSKLEGCKKKFSCKAQLICQILQCTEGNLTKLQSKVAERMGCALHHNAHLWSAAVGVSHTGAQRFRKWPLSGNDQFNNSPRTISHMDSSKQKYSAVPLREFIELFSVAWDNTLWRFYFFVLDKGPLLSIPSRCPEMKKKQ